MANAVSNPASDPALVILANKAIIAARPALTRAKLFTLDISDEAVAPGTTVKVPVYDSSAADAWNDTSKNYGTGTGSITFAAVTFNQFVKSYNFTDAQLAQIPVGLFDRAGEACGVSCGQKVIAAIDTALKSGTYTTAAAVKVPVGTTSATITKAIVSGIVAGCANNPARTVLVLKKEWYYAVAALYDASIYGGPEAVRAGSLDASVYGLKAITYGDIPDGCIGLLVPEDGVVAGVRKMPCASVTAYDEVIDQSDVDTGFPFQVRRYADPATGTNHVAGTVLVGAAVAQASKIQKVQVATS